MGPGPTTRNVLRVQDDDDVRRIIQSYLADDRCSGMIGAVFDPLSGASRSNHRASSIAEVSVP